MRRKKVVDFATPSCSSRDRFVNLGDDKTEEGTRFEYYEIKLETPSSDSDDDRMVALSTNGGDIDIDMTMPQVPGTSSAVMKRGRGRPRKKRRTEGLSLGNSIKKVVNPTINGKRGRGRPKKIIGDRKPGSGLKGRLIATALSGPESKPPGRNAGKDQVRMRRLPKKFLENNEGQGTSRSFQQNGNGNTHLGGHHYDSSRPRAQGIKRKRGRPRKISQHFDGLEDPTKNTNLSTSLSSHPMISNETYLSKVKSQTGQTLQAIKKRGRPRKSINLKPTVANMTPPTEQRGRPRKSINLKPTVANMTPPTEQRGRGRPRKSINIKHTVANMAPSTVQQDMRPRFSRISSKQSATAYLDDSDRTSSPKPAKKMKSRESEVEILDESRRLVLNIDRCDDHREATLVTKKEQRRKRRFSTSESLTFAAPANTKSELPQKKRRGRPPKNNTKIQTNISMSSKVLPPSKKKVNGSISDSTPLLEVCVDTIQSAINAVNGGAKRIELCSALSEGGLTPTVGLLELCKQITNVKIFAMIRPRSGDFLYSENEMQIMERDIMSLKHAGADGFVFGMLDELGNVDDEKCGRLLAAANPLPCTFHRAFDLTCNPMSCLEKIVNLGFDRILTSGLRPSAEEGIPLLKQLVHAANDRITIMAGAGVNPGNVFDIVTSTGVKEVHGSGRVKVFSKMRRTSSESQVGMGTPGEDDSSHFQTSAALVQGIVDQLTFAFKEIERLNSNQQNPEVSQNFTINNNREHESDDDCSKADDDVVSTEPPITLTQLPEENNLESKEVVAIEKAPMIPASSHEPVEVGNDVLQGADVISEQSIPTGDQTIADSENNKITPDSDLSTSPQKIRDSESDLSTSPQKIRDSESNEQDAIFDSGPETSEYSDARSNLDSSESGGNCAQGLNSSENFNPESTGSQMLNSSENFNPESTGSQMLNSSENFNPESTGSQVLDKYDRDDTAGSTLSETPTAINNDTNNLQEVKEIGGFDAPNL